MSKTTICLNMIVKNEAHIIIKTLTNLLSYIPFDYWVISDTGSTDNTKELIIDFFKERNIPGKIVEHEWQDFAYNRTKSIECAFAATDYLFIFDADDEICNNMVLPQVLDKDQYKFKFGKGFSYSRPLLINNHKKWEFIGILHEYLCCIDTLGISELIEGDYYVVSGRYGARSQNPNKYFDDATVLKNAFVGEVSKAGGGLSARYAFYCAQSFKDAGVTHYDDAIEWYKKCLTLNGWIQEKYFACLKIGDLYNSNNDKINAVKYWCKTIEYDTERIEGIVYAMNYYRETGQHLIVNSLYHKFKNYSHQLRDKLFINMEIYNKYELEYNNTISAFYVKCVGSGYDSCKCILLNYTYFNNARLINIINNIIFYTDALIKDTNTFDLFVNVNNIIRNIMTNANAHAIESRQKTTMYKIWDILFVMNKHILTKMSTIMPVNKPKPTVFLSVTTCKRFGLFKQTINSILNQWTDVDKIDYWFCVDDNSSDEDRVMMRDSYSWFDYYMKTPEEKGHRNSMNIIWNKLNELKPTYWIHLEDDFLFHTNKNYVTDSMHGLDVLQSENVKQIVFNRNYCETIDGYDIFSHTLIEGMPDYVLHNHILNKKFNYRNSHYWQHYSLNPSMVIVEPILKLGNYDSENQFFERDYANRWTNAGYKTAFFNCVVSRHIGRLIKERNNTNIANAYILNNENQFTIPCFPLITPFLKPL